MNHIIGKQVAKKSGKPFKSGNKINTVKKIIKHPFTLEPAYRFLEDSSYVAVEMCNPLEV